jgi:uncharacterized protein
MDVPAALLALQTCDLEIRRATKLLDELPEKRAILETRHKAEEVRQLKGKGRRGRPSPGACHSCEHRRGRRSRREDRRVQKTLDSGQVTNPKEVHNLSREMDALKRREDKVDNDTIALMERLEHAREQVAKVDTALERLASREKELIVAYQTKGGEVQNDLDAHKSQRIELAASLGDDLARTL